MDSTSYVSERRKRRTHGCLSSRPTRQIRSVQRDADKNRPKGLGWAVRAVHSVPDEQEYSEKRQPPDENPLMITKWADIPIRGCEPERHPNDCSSPNQHQCSRDLSEHVNLNQSSGATSKRASGIC